MFGGLLDLLLYGIVAVSLMLNCVTEVRRAPILDVTQAGSGASPPPAEEAAR